MYNIYEKNILISLHAYEYESSNYTKVLMLSSQKSVLLESKFSVNLSGSPS